MKKMSATVDEASQGERLDRYIASAFGISRGEARRTIARGGAWVSGKRVKAESRALSKGQKVEAYLLDEREAASIEGLPASLAPTRVLLSDRGVLAVDKPPFVPAQPTPACDRGDLASLAAPFAKGQLRILHRLDLETSGVTLFAWDGKAAADLGRAFRDRAVAKTYLALVAWTPRPPRGSAKAPGGGEECGLDSRTVEELPDEGEVDLPIGPDPSRPGRQRVDGRKGLAAKTRFRVLERFPGGRALVEAMPATGRTHQIRLHLAAKGWPLLGDRTYGGQMALASALRPMSGEGKGPAGSEDVTREGPLKEPSAPAAAGLCPEERAPAGAGARDAVGGAGSFRIPRVMLHAASIRFPHPGRGGNPTLVKAPLPDDFQRVLDALRAMR